ncbi:hypothetical protein COLO4_20655 [Corchorus olitorius]|uniref:F-box domain-containing protein n=1 Tax=Corchorus olitorius TaxID=93759 RepID=A0A1R3IXW9_9ROSI|nr:hypothetical protein COLO4_20655 [Corchorus olitorius]
MDRRKGKKVGACQDGDKGKEDLPTGIIMEILSRLPFKFVLNCRCVCKTWYQIISDPHFVRLHLSRSPVSILAQNGFRSGRVLGEFITIKVPEDYKRDGKTFCFGFSSKTNQYKVLQTFYANNREGPKAEVYTVGTRGSWTSLGNAPISIKDQGFCFDAYLHGAFHWNNVVHSNLQIVCFDFENDMFREVPSPQFPHRQVKSAMLGVLEDCLCVYCYPDPVYSNFEIWVVKDYGVKESWTLKFHFTHTPSIFHTHCYDHYYPLLLLKNGRMLMSYNKKTIACYNLEEKRFMKTDISPMTYHCFISAYTPCFISLKDVAKGEQISR